MPRVDCPIHGPQIALVFCEHAWERIRNRQPIQVYLQYFNYGWFTLCEDCVRRMPASYFDDAELGCVRCVDEWVDATGSDYRDRSQHPVSEYPPGAEPIERTREQACEVLARDAISGMTVDQLRDEALRMGSVGPDDPDWTSLSRETQQQLAKKVYPYLQDVAVLGDLVLLGVRRRFLRYTNLWLTKKLTWVENGMRRVVGTEPELLPCLCCGFHVLSSWAEEEVCEVCGWKDDGIEDIHAYSALNGWSIDSYRHLDPVDDAVELEERDPHYRRVPGLDSYHW